jgi:tRNA-binding protein
MASQSSQPAISTDFQGLGMRVGTIRRVESFPEARKPAFKLWIDFGPFGIKRSSAQITALYTAADLVGRQVICATGLGTKRVAGFESEVLVTGFVREDQTVVLAVPDRVIADGSPLC